MIRVIYVWVVLVLYQFFYGPKFRYLALRQLAHRNDLGFEDPQALCRFIDRNPDIQYPCMFVSKAGWYETAFLFDSPREFTVFRYSSEKEILISEDTGGLDKIKNAFPRYLRTLKPLKVCPKTYLDLMEV